MTDLTKLESQDSWLDGLKRLNAVIAATGETLFGNLFYEPNRPDFATAPPSGVMKEKRERFVAACSNRTQMLEVGVNGCHSAYLALTSNPHLQYCGVDICSHVYVELAVEWLSAEFPGRVQFCRGSSKDVLPRLADEKLRFDVFHIDGRKSLYFSDIRECTRMVEGDALVIVDDSDQFGIRVALRGLLLARAIRPAFPSTTGPEGNEVAWLRRSSRTKYIALGGLGMVLSAGRYIWRQRAGVQNIQVKDT